MKTKTILSQLICGLLVMCTSAFANEDPEKIMGADSCKECHNHAGNIAAWEASTHFKTFREMPRSDKAEEIAGKLEIRRIRTDSKCANCHFTMQTKGSRVAAVHGISCESCHGEAKDWIKVHSDETKDRAARMTEAQSLGMISPHQSYLVAQNCFQCHTVPDEELVNKGGHPAGSDFELVAWSQGEVRHNLLKSENKENVEAPIEQKRKLYITGRLLDLEHSLRALANATEDGAFATAMTLRVNNAKAKVEEINGQQKAAEFDAIIAAAGSAELKINNKDALIKTAVQIAEQAKKWSEAANGADLGGVDSLLPSADQYKGAVYTP